MAFLDLGLRVLAFRDASVTSNPQRRSVDENLQMTGMVVGTPAETPLDLAAGELLTVHDGLRTLGADGTTQFALSISPLSPDRYRLAWTGTGTAPAFRVERAFLTPTVSLTLTLNANLTITVTGAGPSYGTVQVGDQVLIPGAATGDGSSPFDPRNVGYWDVIGTTGSSLTLARPADQAATGLTETVSVTTATQFLAFAATPVQVGDQIAIVAGFSTNARRSFVVLAVSSRWVDLQSTVALAPETATPGAGGLFVYAAAKTIVLLETDQLLGVYVNGAATESLTVDVLTDQAGTRLGLFVVTGPVWQLKVKNKASTRLSGLAVTFP